MFLFGSIKRPFKGPIGRSIFLGAISILIGSSGLSSSLALAKNQADINLDRPNPDVILNNIYKDMAANNLREAQLKADKLVEIYPNFRLGHLIRGDLLMMHSRSVPTFGAAINAPAHKLKDLRDEAIVRFKSLRQRPDAEWLPNSVLQVSPDQKFVLVVDTKQSRLYVYKNLNGQLKFEVDYYVTQGKLGINKFKEGDQKTPIGVYNITSRLAGAKLPDFYGPGALPINYPNEWDKVNGRSGSGIWLHGTPSDSYSRPPLASDGCVVLTNPDLQKLSATIEIGKTPVIISDQVEFVNKTKWEADRQAAIKMIEGWRRDMESMNEIHVRAIYSKKFRSNLGEDIDTWFTKYKQALAGQSALSIKLKDISVFRYPGNEDLIVSSFTQVSVLGKNKSTVRKRQYWAKEGTQWKIVYEGNI
jgi:murein L,D-transpeptidase YafK